PRQRFRLVPGVDVRAEGLALLADHAEAVAAGGFHHPPALAELDLLRTELFQARDLGFDVVGLDVEVDAAVVADLLQQQDRLVVAGIQHGVTAVAVLVRTGDRLAERLAPELDVGGEVRDLAVEDEGGQAAVVGHAAFLRWMGARAYGRTSRVRAHGRYGQTAGIAPRPGCFMRTMRKRWPVGASLLHRRLRNSIFRATRASGFRGKRRFTAPARDRPASPSGSARPRRRCRRGGRRSATAGSPCATRSRRSPG